MAGTKRGRPRTQKAEIRRKNVNIDQVKLDRVKKLLGSNSETEAIDQALDMLLFRDEVISGLKELAGKGGVEDFFRADAEV